MTIKVMCIAAVLSVAAISQASAGGLLSNGGSKGGLLGLGVNLGNSGQIVVAPSVDVLNGNNVGILNGVLNGNSILNGNLNGNNGLLGLGILGTGNSSVSKKSKRY